MAEAPVGRGTLAAQVTGRLSDLRARARGFSPRAVDRGLAVLVAGGTMVEAGFADASGPSRLAALGPALLLAAAMVLRRREAIASVTLAVIGLALVNALAESVWDTLNTPYFAVLVIVYTMASRETGRRLWAAIAISVAGTVVIATTQPSPDTPLASEILVGLGFFVVAPVFAGRLLHSRLRLNEALREKADRAAGEREESAAEAAAAERARIASELHDLVAHALGAMTIQASAARRLGEVDAERAAAALEAIEKTGRDALGELRTLLEVLKDDDAEAPVAPQPTLEALPALAARARGFGLAVELAVEGDRPENLPAGIDLTAYRVVQDALRAARNEGQAGSAEVAVRYRGDRVELEIADDGTAGGERRLLGLRERVRLFGGEVSVRPSPRGGHVVRARLPLERMAA